MIDKGIIIYIITPLVASISQVLLKKSAQNPNRTGIRTYLNPTVILAYLLFFGCMLLNVVALRTVELSTAGMMECLSYVYIMILSALIFKEKITTRKIIGNVLIIAGIILGGVL